MRWLLLTAVLLIAGCEIKVGPTEKSLTIELLSPASGAVIEGDTPVPVTVKINSGKDRLYHVEIDGVEVTSATYPRETATWMPAHDTGMLELGVVTTAIAEIGLRELDDRIMVDYRAPWRATLEHCPGACEPLTENAELSGQVKLVGGSVWDKVELESATFTRDGQTIALVDEAPFEHTWSTHEAPDGAYLLGVTAKKRDGETASLSRTVALKNCGRSRAIQAYDIVSQPDRSLVYAQTSGMIGLVDPSGAVQPDWLAVPSGLPVALAAMQQTLYFTTSDDKLYSVALGSSPVTAVEFATLAPASYELQVGPDGALYYLTFSKTTHSLSGKLYRLDGQANETLVTASAVPRGAAFSFIDAGEVLVATSRGAVFKLTISGGVESAREALRPEQPVGTEGFIDMVLDGGRAYLLGANSGTIYHTDAGFSAALQTIETQLSGARRLAVDQGLPSCRQLLISAPGEVRAVPL